MAPPGCDPKEVWASSVAFLGGRWVGFHAVKVSRQASFSSYGRFAIYVSTASNPMGPFRPASSAPIITTSTTSDPAGAIDPDVYVEPSTGRAFLQWKTEGNLAGNYPAIWSRELDTSGVRFRSGSVPRKLITVSQAWESSVVENPSLVKVEGRYVLLYSGNDYRSTRYAQGYAVCQGPLGPCTKSGHNPILTGAPGAYGAGAGDGLIDERGRFLVSYNAWTGADGSALTGRRVLHVAELYPGPGNISVLRRDIAAGAGPDPMWTFRADGSFDQTAPRVTGSYVPAAGDFDGDGHSDIAWYGAWDRPDTIFGGTRSQGGFAPRALDQRGSFVPVPGDFNADGLDDIFWYQPGGDPIVADPSRSGSNYEPNARPDQVWLARPGGGWAVANRSLVGAAQPLAGDFDGDGDTDILWYRPGAEADVLWRFANGTPTAVTLSIYGNYRPVAGDFDGDGVDDILWHAPGAALDPVWWFDRIAGHSASTLNITGDSFRPFAANVDGDRADEIFFYAPGAAPDTLWTSLDRAGRVGARVLPVGGRYQPVVGDFDANGVDDIFWYS